MAACASSLVLKYNCFRFPLFHDIGILATNIFLFLWKYIFVFNDVGDANASPYSPQSSPVGIRVWFLFIIRNAPWCIKQNGWRKIKIR